MQTHTSVHHGASLTLRLSAVRSLAIVPRDDLVDTVSVDARFEHADEFDDLTVTDGSKVVIAQKQKSTVVTGKSGFVQNVIGNLFGGIFGGNSINVSGDIVGSVVVGGNNSQTVVSNGDVSIVNGKVYKGPVTVVNGVVLQGEEVDASAPGGGAAKAGKPHPVTLEITLGVPRGFAVALNLSGRVPARLGDIDGPLALDLSGHATVSAGITGPLEADISGAASAEIRGVRDKVELNLSSGSLIVGPCEVSTFAGEVSSGSVTFGGSVDELELDVNSATVQVQEARQSAEIKANGGARVTVHKADLKSLEANLNGGSQLVVGGRVKDLEVKANGGASLTVDEVTGDLERDVNGGARVSIGNRPSGPSRRGGWF